MAILIDSENTFDLIHILLCYKILSELATGGNFFSVIKTVWKTLATLPKGEKLKVLLLKSGIRAAVS